MIVCNLNKQQIIIVVGWIFLKHLQYAKLKWEGRAVSLTSCSSTNALFSSFHENYLRDSPSQTLSASTGIFRATPSYLRMLPITEPCTAQCTSNSGRRDDYQNSKLTQNSKISEQSLRLVLPRHFSNPWDNRDNCRDVECLSRCREFPKVSCFPSNPEYETLWLTKDICSGPNGKRKASPTEALGGWGKSPARTDSTSFMGFSFPLPRCADLRTNLGCTCCVRLRVIGLGANRWT